MREHGALDARARPRFRGACPSIRPRARSPSMANQSARPPPAYGRARADGLRSALPGLGPHRARSGCRARTDRGLQSAAGGRPSRASSVRGVRHSHNRDPCECRHPDEGRRRRRFRSGGARIRPGSEACRRRRLRAHDGTWRDTTWRRCSPLDHARASRRADSGCGDWLCDARVRAAAGAVPDVDDLRHRNADLFRFDRFR